MPDNHVEHRRASQARAMSTVAQIQIVEMETVEGLLVEGQALEHRAATGQEYAIECLCVVQHETARPQQAGNESAARAR
jgi:hypothetical protein